MALDIPTDYAEKHSIVNELFVATADENYVTARWCYQNELSVDFLWLSVHCLEKYLKAALLLNGEPATKYSHDIVSLYEAVRPLAPELLPTAIEKPVQYGLDHWHRETSEEFIKRLYEYGQADNRYQFFGYNLHFEDLFKLDCIIFAVRRLCQPLEAHFLGREIAGVPNQSRRERMIIDHPSSANLNSKLEDILSGKRGKLLQHALLNWNFAFAAADYPHPPIEYRTASHNPVLVRRLFDPLRAGPENFAYADRIWEWVSSNIYLSRNLRKEIGNERERLKIETKRNSL